MVRSISRRCSSGIGDGDEAEPWQRLYFFPLPQVHGSFRPIRERFDFFIPSLTPTMRQHDNRIQPTRVQTICPAVAEESPPASSAPWQRQKAAQAKCQVSSNGLSADAVRLYSARAGASRPGRTIPDSH
jgi:hypothetical protein